MKKNTMMRIASTLLIAVLLTTCAIGATFAKYVADATATSSARVANWDIKLDGTTIAGESQKFEFDLFGTVANVIADPLEDDGNVDNRAADTDPAIIAPGTTGTLEFTLTNASEVTAKYWYTLSITETDIPLLFTLDPDDTWSDDIADLNVAYADAVQLDTAANATDGSDSATITIYWKWDFEQTNVAAGDTADTTLGLADILAETTVTLVVNAEQVN